MKEIKYYCISCTGASCIHTHKKKKAPDKNNVPCTDDGKKTVYSILRMSSHARVCKMNEPAPPRRTVLPWRIHFCTSARVHIILFVVETSPLAQTDTYLCVYVWRGAAAAHISKEIYMPSHAESYRLKHTTQEKKIKNATTYLAAVLSKCIPIENYIKFG